jgi:hypothetical protein
MQRKKCKALHQDNNAKHFAKISMQSIAPRYQCKALHQDINAKHYAKISMQSIAPRYQCKALRIAPRYQCKALHTDVAVQRLHTTPLHTPQKKPKYFHTFAP